MRRSLVAAIAALVVLSACGSDEPDSDATSAPTQESSTSAEATASTPPAPADLVLEPGRVGPAVAGMSKDEAVATGLFDADVPPPVDGCEPVPLQWKKVYVGLDVLTRDDGSIASIGVRKGGPRTAEGIGVGSTLGDVQKAYPNLSPVDDAGFDQAGAFVVSGDAYLGLLFGDATKASITPSSKVTFLEVTQGSRPELMRSGC